MCAPLHVRYGMDRLADLLEGPATADVGDGVVDILIGRLRIVLQQRRDRHDHPALAIAALRNVIIDPGLLHLMQRAVGRQTLDGGDLLALSVADHDAARAGRYAVDM